MKIPQPVPYRYMFVSVLENGATVTLEKKYAGLLIASPDTENFGTVVCRLVSMTRNLKEMKALLDQFINEAQDQEVKTMLTKVRSELMNILLKLHTRGVISVDVPAFRHVITGEYFHMRK